MVQIRTIDVCLLLLLLYFYSEKRKFFFFFGIFLHPYSVIADYGRGRRACGSQQFTDCASAHVWFSDIHLLCPYETVGPNCTDHSTATVPTAVSAFNGDECTPPRRIPLPTPYHRGRRARVKNSRLPSSRDYDIRTF